MKKKRRNPLRHNLSFFRDIKKRLSERKNVSASFEAESLIRHFGKMDRLQFFAGERSLSGKAKKEIQKAVKKRLAGEPLGYVLKKIEFYGYVFYVSPDTLIPRPETEILVEETCNILKSLDLNKPQILDIGTGSGCISISLTIQRPDCKMTALDVSSKALRIARKNLDLHGLGKKISLFKSDLFSLFGKQRKNYWDVIVSNPPYIDSEDFRSLSKEVLAEPHLALDGGKKGLEIIYKILDQAPYYLTERGHLLMEIGDGQSKRIAKKISQDGIFKEFRFVKDYTGTDRVLIARK